MIEKGYNYRIERYQRIDYNKGITEILLMIMKPKGPTVNLFTSNSCPVDLK